MYNDNVKPDVKSTPVLYVEFARGVRLGALSMPEPSRFQQIPEWERNFILGLVYDDSVFDFFDSVKEMSWVQIKALKDFSTADEAYEAAKDAYEKARSAYEKAKYRRNLALRKWRELQDRC